MTSLRDAAKKVLTTSFGEWNVSGKKVIVLDFPPKDLFPNRASGKHWGSLYKLKSDYRESSTWLAKSQLGDWKHNGNPIVLTMAFHMPDKRWRDADNCLAAAKAGIDGLADALMINDRTFNPIVVQRILGEKPGKLIITLEAT
jgi:crossover junction endodeoxyribonuclease RusA